MLERTIQSIIIRRLTHDYHCIVVKIDTRGNRGWPDLSVTVKRSAPFGDCEECGWNGITTVFLEVKQPGKSPTPLQERRHTHQKRRSEN